MKFYVSIVLIALLSYAAGLFPVLPWWSFAICTLVVAVTIPQRPFKSFISGFIALFLLWGILSFIIDNNNQHLLSTKVANILPLNGSFVLLIGITAFIGGLVGGLSALTGSYIRKK
jgi:hypothetical protein